MYTQYLTLPEAATFLRISKSSLYKKNLKREIPFVKPGGKLVRYLKSDLEDYISSNHFDSKEAIETNFLNTLIRKGGSNV